MHDKTFRVLQSMLLTHT